MPAQFNRHGNCATATVDTEVLDKFQAACVSKITVELPPFLPCILMNIMEGVAGVLHLVMSNAAALYKKKICAYA